MTDRRTASAPQFQRGDGPARVKKTERRLPVRLRQLLVAIGLGAVAFLAADETYLFVISWPRLEVRTVLVTCLNSNVGAGVEALAREMRWGNILLLDIARTRRGFLGYSWVKDVGIRKVFPDSVRVDVTPREAVAVLAKDTPVLIDPDGVELEPAPAEAGAVFPVFVDSGRFTEDARDKVALGWSCLKDLPPEARADLATLDLSEPGNVVATLRSSSTKLKLGQDLFVQKLAFYRQTRNRWEQDYGRLDYMDLRFPDRIYFRTAEAKDGASPASGLNKEAR